jgi:hypothetical protein
MTVAVWFERLAADSERAGQLGEVDALTSQAQVNPGAIGMQTQRARSRRRGRSCRHPMVPDTRATGSVALSWTWPRETEQRSVPV